MCKKKFEEKNMHSYAKADIHLFDLFSSTDSKMLVLMRKYRVNIRCKFFRQAVSFL